MHNLDKLQIFGDSQLVINWVIGKYKLQNLELSLILQDVHFLSDSFDFVSYKHIYREMNSKADLLANQGVTFMRDSGIYMKRKRQFPQKYF